MIVFIDKSFIHWILGAIIRETAAISGTAIKVKKLSNFSRSLSTYVAYLQLKLFGLPERNLIVNQNNYFSICKHSKISKAQRSKARVFFTHSSVELISDWQLSVLNDCAEIVVMNSAQKVNLRSLGVTNPEISVCFGAVNSNYFFPSQTYPEIEYVYISGDAKGRKQPDKILSVIRNSPEINFVIFGPDWHAFILEKGELLGNVRVAGTTISDSGYFMRNASCYLSLATIEGGPYGTIEALASGTPVVCTPTGWNPEIINKNNGIIVNFDETIDGIRDAIKQVFLIKKQSLKPMLQNSSFNWKYQANVLFKEPINES